jgi:prevent-host-death family protein
MMATARRAGLVGSLKLEEKYPYNACCATRVIVVQNTFSDDRSTLMKTYPLNEARAEFSKLVERALAGEPQRVTRYGKEAVVVVSEAAWVACSRSAPTLGALLAQHARGGTTSGDMTDRPWIDRPLGGDFGGDVAGDFE